MVPNITCDLHGLFLRAQVLLATNWEACEVLLLVLWDSRAAENLCTPELGVFEAVWRFVLLVLFLVLDLTWVGVTMESIH